MAPILEIKNLNHIYSAGTPFEHVALNDVARLADRLLVMCNAHLAMDGAPGDVFEHAQELLDMGLDIPEITRVFLKLQQKGLPVKQVYTMEQAVAELKRLKEGTVNA